MRSRPKAWNQIKIATNANVTVLWDPLLLSSSDFPINIPRPNSRAPFLLVEKNAENLLVNQIPLWAIGAQDISYLGCQDLLPKYCRFFQTCCDIQCLNTFCIVLSGEDMVGCWLEDNSQCCTTSRHWEAPCPEEAPHQPPAIWIASQFFPRPHIVGSRFKSVCIPHLNILKAVRRTLLWRRKNIYSVSNFSVKGKTGKTRFS